jgi:beta-N-acetylhexosaminidase
MSRQKAVPYSIAAGADMFLFARNLQEDFEYMLAGIKEGIITANRLDEAVTRIIATKAALGLHKGVVSPDEETALAIVGCHQHKEWARECADKAITLVKEEPGVLPLNTTRYKKILFYPLEPETGGGGPYQVIAACGRVKALLEKEGFEVEVFTPQPGMEGRTRRSSEITERYDLIVYVANYVTKSNQTAVRIEWAQPMGANCAHYANDVPTIFISLENPYHLLDVPRMKTFINTYNSDQVVIEALIEKLMGRSAFIGHSPVDPFCGKWDARL